jgi:hypothetical protein
MTTRMKRITATLVLLLATTVPVPTTAVETGAGYKIIVNTSRQVESLRRGELADYFLKRASKWPDGTSVVVVDLSTTSPARSTFSKDVLALSVDATVRYWQQQIFSGRGTPPPVKALADILQFVVTTPGAIAYVPDNAALPASVRVVMVKAEAQ